VKQGEDDTLFALADGFVKFSTKRVRAFTGKLVQRRYVSVADKIVSNNKVKVKTVAKVKTVKTK
jgi:ribosomal protein L27